MAKLVSNRTAGRIMALLNRADLGAASKRGGGAARWAFVRCDSETAVGGSDVLDQCYPATVLLPAANAELPPEEAGEVLLTLLTDDGAAAEPTEGAVYVCLLTGEVLSDRSGAGPEAENGRCRAFGLAPPEAGVAGSGTDNRVVRWDGTSAIQDSYAVLNDSGALKLSDISGPSSTQRELTVRTYTFGLGDQAAVVEGRVSGSGGTYQDYQLGFTANSTGNINTMFLGFGDATFGLNDGLTYVNTSNDGSGQLYVGSDGAGATYSTSVKLGGSVAASVQLDNRNVSPSVQNLVVSFGSDTAGYSATVSGVVRDGATGTLAPGALFAGGICYDLGTGSFVGTASSNSFTNQNSFAPANSSTVPVTIQGAASQSANLTEWKDSGGTVLGSVSAAGVLTASALNGTYDGGTF